MSDLQNQVPNGRPAQPFRMDVELHELLTKPAGKPPAQRAPKAQGEELLTLPEPVYPQCPRGEGEELSEKAYHRMNAIRGLKGWAVPYFKSLFHKGELRPIITYLFTEFKCNVDCHYCWSFNNNIKGMSEDVGRRSIDWIHSIGGRVLALMGGEPLLRPQYVHKITYYAAQKNFFVYLPTNGYLMRPEVIDRIGNKYNRLVIFDGFISHKSDEYFGSDKESGRLFQTFFFDCEPDPV